MQLAFLLSLPFGVSFIEWVIGSGFINLLGQNLNLLKTSITCIGIFIFILLSGNHYGLHIDRKYFKLTAFLLVLLVLSSLFISVVLKIRSVDMSNWNFRWMVWILGVFREEFVLRGYIQTRASQLLRGKLLGISNAIWFTSVVFALWHLVNFGYGFTLQSVVIQMAACLFVGGPLLGWIRERTNSVIISYLVHQVSDFFFYALYLLVFSKPLF